MSGPPGDTLLALARQAIKQGDIKTARRLLLAAARKQPDNYQVWLWLAGLTASHREALDYLERAEVLRPGDPTVAKARAWVDKRMPIPTALAPEAPPQTALAPPTLAAPPQSQQLSSHERESSAVKYEPAAPRAPKSRRRLWLLLFLLIILVSAAAALSLTGPTLTGWLAELRDGRAVATVTIQNPELAVSLQNTPIAPTITRAGQPEATAKITLPAPQTTPNLPAKNVVAAAADSRPTWTVTPVPTNTPTPTPTYAPTFVASGDAGGQIFQPPGLAPNERWIDVSLSTQRLVAYQGNLPVFETLVSTGKAQYPTVTGQFRIWLRLESQDMDGYRLGFDYYLKGVPYVQYFYQDYALHGTYWHSNFGHPMSHGCVNLSPADAAWLFDFANYGTLVNVHP
jgi:lipoprotein-anchoring transpeptidase ErfK/SrfK